MAAVLPCSIESRPSEGPTVRSSMISTSAGSAPARSTMARSLASSWVPLPVMMPRPSLILLWMTGAEYTDSSRTMAMRSPMCAPVMRLKSRTPSSVVEKLTMGWPMYSTIWPMETKGVLNHVPGHLRLLAHQVEEVELIAFGPGRLARKDKFHVCGNELLGLWGVEQVLDALQVAARDCEVFAGEVEHGGEGGAFCCGGKEEVFFLFFLFFFRGQHLVDALDQASAILRGFEELEFEECGLAH